MAVRIRTEPVTAERVVSHVLICNRCGREADLCSQDGYERREAAQYLTVDKTGGFGGRFPEDCQRIRWHLCQDCHRELVQSFRVAPLVEDDLLPLIADIPTNGR